MRFDVLAFGPGLRASGTPASLEVTGSAVDLRAGDVARGASVAELELRDVGFGRPGVELAWGAGDDRWVVHLLDPDAAGSLLASPAFATAPQAAALRSARRRRAARRTFGWTAIAAVVLLPVLLLGVFLWQSDRIADWAVRRIPIETEIRLGHAAFADLRRGLDLQTSGGAYDAVQAIGRRLTDGSKYRYEFHVARDEAVNAYALPGGIVVVNTGLIAATKRPEELAGVLAHEVEHVELRHSLSSTVKNLGLRALWALATGDVGGTLAGEAAVRLTSLRFSRAAEEQADAAGFARLVERGIDPSGMSAFFTTLERQDAASPPALLSTHPASADRARALAAKLEALGGRRFEPLPFAPWPPG